MELYLKTAKMTDISTEGELSIEDAFECYTLELPVRDGLPGSAIPAGRFQIEIAPSPKFIAEMQNYGLPLPYRQFVANYANEMPHIIGIPGRSLIMFHWGNTPEQTLGCVLTGMSAGVNEVEHSQQAFAAFYPKIYAEAKAGNCWVTVTR